MAFMFVFPSNDITVTSTTTNRREGRRNYGHTKEGAYMCEADAKAAGNRAAKDEKHP